MNYYIHKTSDVQSSSIGDHTKIWQFVVVLPNAKIGCEVNICAYCFIENDVLIGNRVTIKSGVHLWDGIRIEDDVFIGPNATFTNDKFPRSKVFPKKFLKTHIEKGASIGAGAVILPGITIGMGAMIGAGAVVTKSVPAYAVVKSPPATISYYKTNRPFLEKEKINPTNNKIQIGIGDTSLHRFNTIQDSRGELSVGEFIKEIPFTPKRYFLVFNVPSGKVRGGHAHFNCHQFLICVKGSCSVLVDNGKSRTEILLNTPNLGLYLPPLIWGTQYNHSTDAVLLVFTSEYYQSDDYIRDYTKFCNLSIKEFEFS